MNSSSVYAPHDKDQKSQRRSTSTLSDVSTTSPAFHAVRPASSPCHSKSSSKVYTPQDLQTQRVSGSASRRASGPCALSDSRKLSASERPALNADHAASTATGSRLRSKNMRMAPS